MKPADVQKGRRTLIFSTITSTLGPLLLVFTMTDHTSTTQLADLIRRSCEFLSLFFAWMVYEVTLRHPENSTHKARLEAFIRYFTGFSMCLSGCVMLFVAIVGFGEEKDSVFFSFLLAFIGAIVNGRLYINYKSIQNNVMSLQAKLHRVRMLLDLALVLILLVWILSSSITVKSCTDLAGSCMISLYLIWNGIRVIREKEERHEEDQ